MKNFWYMLSAGWTGALLAGLVSVNAHWTTYSIIGVTAILHYGVGVFHNAE